MNSFEQTLSIIKPDAVERGLIEEIISIFEKNNLNVKVKKFISQRKKPQSFTKCISQTFL